MCSNYDYDPVTLLNEAHRTARKAHKCHECRRVISAGEVYLYQAYKSEGDMSQHKTCAYCHEIAKWLIGECGTCVFGEAIKEFREHLRWNWRLKMARVAIGAKWKWRRRDGSLLPVPVITMEEAR